MHLEAEISASHRVKEVESYREILSETCLDNLTEHLAAPAENKILGRELESGAVHFQEKAVFFRNAIEAPSEVGPAPVKVTNLLHPLATPRCRVKERNHPERIMSRQVHSPEESLTVNHLRGRGIIGVNPEVHLVHNLVLVQIEDSPVNEQASLVLDRHCIFAVVHAQSFYLVPAEALLDFPTCHVHIGYGGSIRSCQCGTGTENQYRTLRSGNS